MCTSPRLVDASVVDFAPSNFKCSSSSSQQIKELLEELATKSFEHTFICDALLT